jgi:hypothetical protein
MFPPAMVSSVPGSPEREMPRANVVGSVFMAEMLAEHARVGQPYLLALPWS